jgi:hypothetical protein
VGECADPKISDSPSTCVKEKDFWKIEDCDSCVSSGYVWAMGGCLKSCSMAADSSCWEDVEGCNAMRKGEQASLKCKKAQSCLDCMDAGPNCVYNEYSNKCYIANPFWTHRNEVVREKKMCHRKGGGVDNKGCRASAGYIYCKSLSKCVRPWETKCPSTEVPYCDKLGIMEKYCGSVEGCLLKCKCREGQRMTLGSQGSRSQHALCVGTGEKRRMKMRRKRKAMRRKRKTMRRKRMKLRRKRMKTRRKRMTKRKKRMKMRKRKRGDDEMDIEEIDMINEDVHFL